jgi:hypothetical protein
MPDRDRAYEACIEVGRIVIRRFETAYPARSRWNLRPAMPDRDRAYEACIEVGRIVIRRFGRTHDTNGSCPDRDGTYELDTT